MRQPFKSNNYSARVTVIFAVLAAMYCVWPYASARAQTDSRSVAPRSFRIGEKLSFNVSFEQFQNVAVIETQVVSMGKLRGRDAIELRGRVKTFELVSAAFKIIDETRTVYVTPDTGMPLFIDRTVNEGPLPKHLISDHLAAPSTGLDLLSLIYKIREAGGNGSFSLIEDGETHIVTAQTGKTERVRTQAGNFDTTITNITSTYLDTIGIRSLTINLSSDGNELPVMITIRTARGEYKAELTNVQIDTPSTVPAATPTPTIIASTKPTPVPQVTPTPYIDNQPLLGELSFEIGETLEYNLSRSGQPAGTVQLRAVERKLFQGKDSLKLEFSATSTGPGNAAFSTGDNAIARTDPETLAPLHYEINFKGPLNSLNLRAFFDQKSGTISYSGAKSVEAPIGTHTLLTLIYAIRSFNLKPSKDPTNPVNDTRVAVFWEEKPYIFTLRPGSTELMTLGSEKVPSQVISINSGVKQLDTLGIKVWLSADTRRLPMRIVAGDYQADLVTISKTLP